MDPERIDDILDFIEAGREQYGSQTFDQHLKQLVSEGLIGTRAALAAAGK